MDHDTIDIQPWPPVELVGRAVCLATVARRGALEVESDRDAFDLETDRFELATWARTELISWIGDNELDVLTQPINELDEDDLAFCDDALIGASTIAWAIRAIPDDILPLSQDGAAELNTLDWSPEPWARVRQLVNRARVRSDDDLARERERWELWYWRSHDAAASDLPDVCAEAEASGLIPTDGRDFLNEQHVRFGDLSADDQDDVAWLSELRLRALNWTCGLASAWESAPTYVDDGE